MEGIKITTRTMGNGIKVRVSHSTCIHCIQPIIMNEPGTSQYIWYHKNHNPRGQTMRCANERGFGMAETRAEPKVT